MDVARAVGAIVGALAVWRVEPLDAGVELMAPIRAYDIWWPVFTTWVGLCCLEAVLSMVRVPTRSVKVLVAAALVMGFTFWAIRRQVQGLHYADPQSEDFWRATLYVGLPALMGATTWLFLLALPRRMQIGQRWRVGLTVVAGTVGLVSSYLWLHATVLPFVIRPWFLWVVSLVVAVSLAALSLWRRWKAGSLHLPDVGMPGRWDDAVGVAALLAIAAGLSDALYLTYTSNRVLDLVLVLVGWGTFVEVISVGPLSEFFGRPLVHSLLSLCGVEVAPESGAPVTVGPAAPYRPGRRKARQRRCPTGGQHPQTIRCRSHAVHARRSALDAGPVA